MRRKWIHPFDLYESLMWRNKQQMKARAPEESGKNEIRLVSEALCNESECPLLIMAENSIQNEMGPEFEEQMQEREKDMGEIG